MEGHNEGFRAHCSKGVIIVHRIHATSTQVVKRKHPLAMSVPGCRALLSPGHSLSGVGGG